MWTLSREMRFEASHQLEMHGGKCRGLHGHSWRVRVTVHGHRLFLSGPATGMLMDYSRLGATMEPVRQQLDHKHLNDLGIYPTSENLATWIYKRLEENFSGRQMAKIKSVELWETEGNSCTYEPEIEEDGL